MSTHPKPHFRKTISALQQVLPPEIFTCARKWQSLANPHLPGTVGSNNVFTIKIKMAQNSVYVPL